MATQPTHESEGLEGVGAGLTSLVKMLQVLFFGLRILIIGIFVWLVFSGVFKVEDGKEALLFRFGKLQKKVIDPTQGPTEVLRSGHWYWAWPYPIDSVRIIPAQQAISVSTDTIFWPRTNPNEIEAPNPAALRNMPLVPGQDGYLLTGDTNIMHTVWSLTYRVTDARKYYLDIYDDPESDDENKKVFKRGHDAIIQDLLANSVLAEIGTWSVEDVLRSSRQSPDDPEVKELLTDRVRDRLEAHLEKLDLGIEIQMVNLVEIQPPTATFEAFRKVVDAATDQNRLIEEAEKYKATVIPKAEGEAYRILDEARAYRTRIVESVKAEGAYFETVRQEYLKNPKTMLVALYSDAIRDVLQKVETKYIIHANTEGEQEVRLLLGPDAPKIGAKREEDTDQK